MSDKYIIKNCPCFFEENEAVDDYTCAWTGTEELACQDCTDCVLKQIVELCKPLNTKQPESYYNLEILLAKKILQFLDIRKVE